MKCSTRDYVHHICPHATFGQDRTWDHFFPYNQSYHSFFVNVNNFHRSLTTVVKAQSNTSKTAKITDTFLNRKM